MSSYSVALLTEYLIPEDADVLRGGNNNLSDGYSITFPGPLLR